MRKSNKTKEVQDLQRSCSSREGFAIVATITLMILLSMIAIGVLSLATVTLRSSGHDLAHSQARANARMGLILAMGELQKSLGPDQRISARAETLARDKRVGVTIPSSTAKAWWVGASSSDINESIGDNEQSVVWLVSGLDSNASSGDQIEGEAFEAPVMMYGENTIDVDRLTGGEGIQAGKVPLTDSRGKENGGYAYFIDDEGMKAQLAAANPLARNDGKVPAGGGLLPGTYELDQLQGMDGIAGTPLDTYQRLISLEELPFLGLEEAIPREKRFSYTVQSQGVLSDVRKGGLKRDLTIAFENDQVFSNVFSNNASGSGFEERYIVMDSEKFQQSSDLAQNGYIHWDVFRDYYNLKKHIRRIGGTAMLDPILFSKDGISNNQSRFGRGELGPHDIGSNSNVPDSHQSMPYGNYGVFTDNKAGRNPEEYKHSPIGPILARMQQNAWVDIEPAGGTRLRTNVQLLTSHYNPYNISLNLLGDAPTSGPRVLDYPQVRFTLRGSNANRVLGLGAKRQSHVPHQVILGPGRSHVCAFRKAGVKESENDENSYDDKVKDLTLESIYGDTTLTEEPTGAQELIVNFVLERPSFSHGVDEKGGPNELAQVFWAPYGWDAIDRSSPGKSISRKVDDVSELNENTTLSHSFHLRTTRESDGAVRPLVDANIRAIFNNPKWDSPLGLEALAAYSPENQGVVEDEPFFQMNTVDDPVGYSYWGADKGPADGSDRVVLFDIPREDLVSLGQLQHASAGRFSYEPTYIVGNSYANRRIPTDDWRASISDSFSTDARGLQDFVIPGNFNVYDASYLVNEELWDSYIFTTIPQVADNFSEDIVPDPQPTEEHFQALLGNQALLPNPRFTPYEPEGSQFNRATLQQAGDQAGTTGSFFHNAGHLMVDGSFNINSTSADAWEAFLSGVSGSPYLKLGVDGLTVDFEPVDDSAKVRFPRVKYSLGEPTTKDSLDENFWTGFRALKQEEVRELAEQIVEEVKERGPFLSLSEFVNRKLENGIQGERGALQAALDRTVNSGISGDFEQVAKGSGIPNDSTQGAGFPGQLLQGDILQALSPYMAARSDTFRIRAYGEAKESGTGKVTARAWCEAVVQRVPDPLNSGQSAKSPLAELANPTSKFGRVFKVSSFRWLSPNEI